MVRYGENLLVSVFVEAELSYVVSDYYWDGVPVHSPDYFGTATRCKLRITLTYIVNESLPQLGRFTRHDPILGP